MTRKKESKATWFSARVSRDELADIKRLVKEGKYASQSELLRSGVKMVLLIEKGTLEQIADVIRGAREVAAAKDKSQHDSN